MTTQAIFRKITAMEAELQKIKLEAYWNLPPQQKKAEPNYLEQAVLNAVKSSRNKLWRKRYAKKI